jgi:hypothetical protein
MYLLEKTRAASYANRSPVHRFGFVSAAGPINCVAEVTADANFALVGEAEGEAVGAFAGVVEGAIEVGASEAVQV